MAKVADLTDETDEPVCFKELREGSNVLFTLNESSYPVTVLKLLGNSECIVCPVCLLINGVRH